MSMITYNMRYRGPFEYDKFVLNAFQLNNETQRIVKKTEEYQILKARKTAEGMDRITEEINGDNGILKRLCIARLRRGMP